MYGFYAAYCTEQSLLSAIEQKDNKEVESIMQSALKKFHTILGLELKSQLAANSNSVTACIDLTMTDVTKVDGKQKLVMKMLHCLNVIPMDQFMLGYYQTV